MMRLAVTIPEAAEMLSVSPRTVQNYITAKVLAARKVGRRTVIRIRDLENFLRTDQPSVSPPRHHQSAEGDRP